MKILRLLYESYKILGVRGTFLLFILVFLGFRPVGGGVRR